MDKKIDFKFSVSPKNKTTQLKKFGALIFEKQQSSKEQAFSQPPRLVNKNVVAINNYMTEMPPDQKTFGLSMVNQ